MPPRKKKQQEKEENMPIGTIGGYYANMGHTTGGASGTNLRTYVGSAQDSAHEKLVRGIAKEMKSLGITGVNANESDLNKVCSQMMSAMPKGVKKDGNMHKDLTKKFAKAMNRVYGSDIIDPEGDASVVSQQILELLSSLCSGLGAEHVALKSEVKRIIKNLKDLNLLRDRSYRTLIGKCEDSDDQTLKSQVQLIKTVNGLLRSETDRQIAMLENLYKTVVEPTSRDVASILEENKDLNRIVKRVKGQPGTQAYSQKLMAGLSGVGNVALMAHDVRRALEKIGMSLADYENAKTLRDLEVKANKLMESKLDLKNPKLTEISAFMSAVDMLRKAEYYRPEVSKALKNGGAVVGGRYKGVAKRIKKRRKLRDSIFRNYNAELGQHFDSMVDNVERVSKQMGKTLVITEQLDQLVSALTNLPDLGKKYIYYSLSGYIDDTQARARREFFINQLNFAVYAIDRLLKMDSYKNQHEVLKSLRDSIVKITDLVKRFKEYFASGWKIQAMEAKSGAGPTKADLKKAVKQSIQLKKEQDHSNPGPVTDSQQQLFNNGLTPADVTGGALDDTKLPEVTKSAYKLREVLDNMRYYYNLAKARHNLSKAAAEVSEAGEDYKTILGDAIGKKLEKNENDHLSSDSTSMKSRIERLKTANAFSQNSDLNSKIASELLAFNKDIYVSKRDLYRTAEAVEVYLQNFSDAISRNPEEVKSLQETLASVKLAAKWFSNDTGKRLCEVFDEFPQGLDNRVANNGAEYTSPVGAARGNHYYERIENAINAAAGPGAVPGIPFIPMDIQKAKQAKKKAERAVKSLTVLKNLVSAFISIGSKFEGKELRKSTHMTTEQIYTNLSNYLWVSAFVNGFSSNTTRHTIPTTDVAGMMPANNLNVDATGDVVIGADPSNPAFGVPAGDADQLDARGMRMVTMDGFLEGPVGTNYRLNDTFEETDRLFTMIIKCLLSKPLTVVGIYNMYNRPEIRNREMTPSRMVLGGADFPKVESKLMPLYIRLPLLAEFYREVFNFEGFTGAYAVSMVPEGDGLFSGFIELMFKQTRHVQRGFYSESQAKHIVEEVNRIYSRFGSKKETVVTDILHEFVAEINRRYGLVERSDREEYNKERRRLRGYDSDYKVDLLDEDYPILEGEDDPDIRMPAPSDAYIGITSRNYQTDAELDLKEKTVINEFRRKIDALLYREEITSNTQDYQFGTAIYQAQQELGTSNDDKERFNIVLEAIQGVGRFLRHGGVKTIMFGESVVNELNLLGALYSQLNSYRKLVMMNNVGGFEEDLRAFLAETSDTPAPQLARPLFRNWIWARETSEQFYRRYTTVDELDDALQNCFGIAGLAGNIEKTNGVFTAACTVVWAGLNGRSGNEFSQPDLSADAQAAVDGVMAGVQTNDVFNNLHSILFSQDTDLNKLVRVRILGGESNRGDLLIDHSNLKSKIEDLFKQTKEMLEKFRGTMSHDDLVRFEREEQGSVYFIEEHLLDELVRGVEADTAKPISLDQIDGYITKSFKVLQGKDVSGPIANEIYGFNAGGRPQADALANSPGVLKVLTMPAPAGVQKPAGLVAANTYDAQPNNIYNITETFNVFNKSLFLLMNELLFKYMNMSWDSAAQKMYRKCLDNIAGGVFSDAVSDPDTNSYPDLHDPAAGVAPVVYDSAIAPDSRQIITRVNAYIMRNLLNSSTNQGRPAYIVQELADVPNHMKDRFRANYPFVVKCADTLIRRCELVKGYRAAGLNLGADVVRDLNVVTKISQALFGIRNSAADVLKELDDQPKYLEVSDGALDYHRSLQGQLPIMPLSSTSCLLQNVTPAPGVPDDPYYQYPLLPFGTQGKSAFKLRYGTRQLLGRPESQVSLDHMPWMKETLQAYNGVSEARFQINESEFSKLTQSHVDLLRYHVDSKHMRSHMIGGLRLPSLAPAVGNNQAPGVFGNPFGIYQPAAGKTVAVYSLQQQPQDVGFSDVLAMTESTFDENMRMKLSQALTSQSVAHSRAEVAVRNLLDMNIVPINIRALMREVALINIYNYSYTWDHMVTDMFGYHPANPLAIDTNSVDPGSLRNPRDVFVRMLIQPYQHVNFETYYGSMPMIMSGLIGMNMDRPKFLGDQFFNKALLGELYANDTEHYLRYANGNQTYHQMTKAPGAAPGARETLNQQQGYGLGADAAQVVRTQYDSDFSTALGSTRERNIGPGQRQALFTGDYLTFLKDTGKDHADRVTQVTVGNAYRQALKVVGKLRFDTKFARNIIFLVQCQRALRLKLANELSWNKRIVSGSTIVDPKFTESTMDKSGFDPEELRLRANTGKYRM